MPNHHQSSSSSSFFRLQALTTKSFFLLQFPNLHEKLFPVAAMPPRKRKLESDKSFQLTNPPKQIKQEIKEEEEEEFEDQTIVEEFEDQTIVEDGEEEEDDEVGEEEEEEEDDEEEEEDCEGASDPTVNTSSLEAAAAATATTSGGNQEDEDDDEESIENLLEPFSKERLINILREAAGNHSDVADCIRKIADEESVHRKIFVHGLGWDATSETLVNAFKEFGEIEDFKVVCDKISGKSKGYGFILFKTRRAAKEALKEPQKKIGGRMTACQLASMGPVPTQATTATPATVQPQQVSEYTQRKIYVSNVGAELDPQKLLAFFSKYGEIEEGPLGLDKATGRPKGFCLFVYRTVDGAKKALEESHKNFEGHILHCHKAIDGPKQGKFQHNHNKPHKTSFQRNNNSNLVGSTAGQGHLMTPSAAAAGMPFNQGVAAQALNPILGQALSALLATQGVGLTNLLGQFGTGAMGSAMPSATHGIQGGYGNQGVTNNQMGLQAAYPSQQMGGYGNQVGLQAAYPSQQIGQGTSGNSQYGVGHSGGAAPYMGQ